MDTSTPGRVSLRARVVIPVGASPEIIAFVQEAVLIYGRVQTSLFRTGKVDSVRAYLSSSMGEQLVSADRLRPSLGPSSEVQARFLNWDRTASEDIVTVRFLPAAGGVVDRRGEDWVFKRARPDALRPQAAPVAATCPSCGAPEAVFDGTCRYCKAAVVIPVSPTPVAGGWYVDSTIPAMPDAA